MNTRAVLLFAGVGMLYVLTGLLQILSTDYKVAVSFTILIIVLLFMPTGIFKGK